MLLKYEIEQATENDIEWIAQLEKDVYSFSDAIPLLILKEWYKTNSNGFFILKKEGLKIGHIDFLPFRQGRLTQFLSGEINEQGIHRDFLISTTQNEEIKHIYIESLAITNINGHKRSYALKFLLSMFDSLIQNMCTPSHSTMIYAMPASNKGLNLISKLNFKKFVDGKKRIDGHSMYKIQYFDLLKSINKYTINM